MTTKVGVGGSDETKDLIWIGNPVNKSTKISDNCKSSYNIGISKFVYNNLNDEVKYHEKDNGYLGKTKVDMWTQGSFTYNGQTEVYYRTNYHWIIS